METDICECGDSRGAHVTRLTLLGSLLKPGLKGETTGLLELDGCLAFRLDRKATWSAERGRKTRRTCLLLTGCVTCGATSATYRKGIDGRYLHQGCPGPKAAA